MKPAYWRDGGVRIAYDADLLTDVLPALFEVNHWHAQGRLVGTAQSGRGTTVFVRAATKQGEQDWALRHFRRGSWLARWIPDAYLWWGLNNTRAWREWHLLLRLQELNLPAPVPVACQVARRGFFYHADLVTRRINGARTLSDGLLEAALPETGWRSVGTMLRRFHDASVYHHDLTSDNILRSAGGSLYLLDFDRARLRPDGAWKRANLARLKRSLDKRKRLGRVKHFDDSDWQALLAGYAAGVS
ncbi:MAG: 3-deoxy-D-manno-octulosonic acid kinase [Nevskiales bacterium]